MEFLRWTILIIITMVIAPLAQTRAHESIREKCFKLYKVKYFGFLFRAFQDKSPSTHGLILPMLYVQAQGYVIGISNAIFALINYEYFLVDYSVVFGTIACSAFFQFISTGIILMITSVVSKKREDLPKYRAIIKKDKKREREFKEFYEEFERNMTQRNK